MWAIGVFDFGLSSEQFWKLTPAQFEALSRRHEIVRQQDDLGFGIVASTVANCHRNPKKRRKPYEPADFMPKYGGESKQKKKKQTSREMRAYWDTHVLKHFQVIDKRKPVNAN